MQTLLQTMKDYNEIVERLSNAEKYFQLNPDAVYNEKLMQKFNELLKSREEALNGIKKLGYKTTIEEHNEGFRQVKALQL